MEAKPVGARHIKHGKPTSRPASARERIDQTAYELFSRHGIRAVGVDTISARSGVAKMTLYRHYPSKDDLALAFLRRREELWTRSWLQEHSDPGHPVRRAAEAHIETVRAFLRQLAAGAGVRDADAFARQLQMVMMGSIVAAYAGDRDAARRAKELGSLLLARAGIRTGKGAQS